MLVGRAVTGSFFVSLTNLSSSLWFHVTKVRIGRKSFKSELLTIFYQAYHLGFKNTILYNTAELWPVL